MTGLGSKILVVDDDPVIRGCLDAYLTDFGFDVSTTADADEAKQIMARCSFTAAIVDLNLPGAEGESLIQQLQEISPSTRFLIHTGQTDFVLSESLMTLGMQPEHVFLKPLSSMAVLVSALRVIQQDEKA